MKKIDKLILSSFIGPFLLTFFVVVFILLNINMLKYFDDLIGKGLGWSLIGQLLYYFAVFTIPTALPLAVLLSSLITFGNLGEHFELTAIKSLGISLIRSLAPMFVFILFLTGVAFYANNYWVPKAALEAYSLLYDIKQKKPALDLREGAFYNGIPDISIKISDRLPDDKTIKKVIIYDHRGRTGNKEVTVADSGKMYTVLGDQYLKLELFNGFNYSEGNSNQDISGQSGSTESLRKTKFDKTQVVFDLSSFGLARTDKKWFQSNRMMRNLNELKGDMDSIHREANTVKLSIYKARNMLFSYHFKDSIKLPPELETFQKKRDSIRRATKLIPETDRPNSNLSDFQVIYADSSSRKKWENQSDTLFEKSYSQSEITNALNQARGMKSQLTNFNANLDNYNEEFKVFQIQWHSILSSSLACIAMFLIGAPLGAIIKKGGLGVPVLTSILFFILYYVATLIGQKWAKQGSVTVPEGVWAADAILFFFGIIFLRQARRDARLFDTDFYLVLWDKGKRWLASKGFIKLKVS
jgi:lipopolysaccharide export system permease protein